MAGICEWHWSLERSGCGRYHLTMILNTLCSWSIRSIALAVLLSAPVIAQERGYYREPALHDQTLVFVAEGDLWTVGLEGGLARRLTSHAGVEQAPAISPDGREVLFSATYDGPTEVYTMPIAGGVPARITWEEESSIAIGWAPDGDVLYKTYRHSTLPDWKLVRFDRESLVRQVIPLSQASDGAFDESGDTLFFVRPGFHRNNTRRYQGGTARNLWRFTTGDTEATNMTVDFAGGDHSPMVHGGRVYWVNDQSGMMNLWSMTALGEERTQLTEHSEWEVKTPSMDASGETARIVYQLGADVWSYDPGTDESQLIDIRLQSDFEQLAEIWEEKPLDYLTRMAIDEEGEHVVLTSRGRAFVFPVGHGRRLQVDRKPGVRYRDVVFLDSDRLLLLSDESGEVEFETRPANGIGEAVPLSKDGTTLRFEGHPSPEATHIAFEDKNNELKILEVTTGVETLVTTDREGVRDFTWSPDGNWLCYSHYTPNTFTSLWLYELATGQRTLLTSDRTNSYSATFSSDGKWIYFLSDRSLKSSVSSPWGPRQPEPYFDRTMEIYQISLVAGERPTFWPDDELTTKEDSEEENDEDIQDDEDADTEESDDLVIDVHGIASRLWRVPVAAGNYSGLQATEKTLFFVSSEAGGTRDLKGLKVAYDEKPVTVLGDVSGYELSGNGKKLLVRQKKNFYVVPAKAGKAKLDDAKVDLSGWSFPISLREDYRQMFIDGWRLERDYFYDPAMHGLDWEGVRDKYLPLVDRVTTRAELSHLLGEVVAELSALHVSVRGGDQRKGDDNARIGALGARLRRDANLGGFVVEHIFQHDADYPAERSPLGDPYHSVPAGAVLLAINGTPTLSVSDIGELLRNQIGNPVRIQLRDTAGSEPRDILVEPIARESSLRYSDWEQGRRAKVEVEGAGNIGYVHLRAMSGSNLTEWYRNFYPVFNRGGLIVDVRHNPGGNIDSLILEKLIRKAWFYWQSRNGEPYWNMNYAFRGHMVVLVDERTGSDGEAFAEGFRRLGCGPVIGARTWGGEIWLSSNNRMSDNGLARAPQTGVYGPEGEWLIEGHGVDPDIVVDNLPHATFNNGDAQLDKAIEVLLKKLEEDPRAVPKHPAYPDKSYPPK